MPALDKLSRVADVSYTVARRLGSLTLSTVRQVAGIAFDRRPQNRTKTPWTPPPPVSSTPGSTTPRAEPPAAPSPAAKPTPDPEPAAAAAAVPTPAAAAAAPPTAPEPAEEDHVSREAVLVAESADTGAADGAGAQITVGEPWNGYGKLTAKEVNDRLVTASPEALAIARLYETANRNRVTVLKEIDRRLAAGEG